MLKEDLCLRVSDKSARFAPSPLKQQLSPRSRIGFLTFLQLNMHYSCVVKNGFDYSNTINQKRSFIGYNGTASSRC